MAIGGTYCDGCRFPGIPLKEYPCSPVSRRKETRMLCKICAATFIGNSLEYPEQYPNAEVMQVIGYCTNLILQRLDAIDRKVKAKGPYDVSTL